MVDGGSSPGGPPGSVTVVGIGADGWDGVPARLRDLVLAAPVLVGGRRHLALVPPVAGQHRTAWPSPLRDRLPAMLASLPAGPVVALASGDPLLSGIATTLVELLGADAVVCEPGVSSVALARARMSWPAESCVVVSLVGRDPSLVRRELSPGRRVLVLSADAATPGQVAGLLTDSGYGETRLTVLGDLGSDKESRVETSAREWLAAPPPDVAALHVLALSVRGPRGLGWTPGLPDDAYEHDGQLTKRDLRASALARLAPAPGEHLWDVGAGAGSVGIEWMRAHPSCTATAVEAEPARAARIARNAARLGVPGLAVVTGRAPGALEGLPPPDAVFVGGAVAAPGVVPACLERLAPSGRLVAHAVTLESERVLLDACAELGGELTRIGVEAAAPLGSMTGWTPARSVTQWAFSRSLPG